jgi:hypothetical protein
MAEFKIDTDSQTITISGVTLALPGESGTRPGWLSFRDDLNVEVFSIREEAANYYYVTYETETKRTV